jgi:hypothetical protein
MTRDFNVCSDESKQYIYYIYEQSHISFTCRKIKLTFSGKLKLTLSGVGKWLLPCPNRNFHLHIIKLYTFYYFGVTLRL